MSNTKDLNQHELEIVLSKLIEPLGGSIHDLLKKETGQERIGFLLATFPYVDGDKQFSYISNLSRDQAIKTLEGLLTQLKRPKYKIQPYHEEVKIN